MQSVSTEHNLERSCGILAAPASRGKRQPRQWRQDDTLTREDGDQRSIALFGELWHGTIHEDNNIGEGRGRKQRSVAGRLCQAEVTLDSQETRGHSGLMWRLNSRASIPRRRNWEASVVGGSPRIRAARAWFPRAHCRASRINRASYSRSFA